MWLVLEARASERPPSRNLSACSAETVRLDSAVRGAIAPMAKAIRPLLNRLVFNGIATCRGLFAQGSARVRIAAGPGVVIHAIATGAIERIAPELSSAGLTRRSRTAAREEWVHGDRVHLVVSSSGGAEPDSPAAVATEYAALLTRTVPFDDGVTIRVSALPAQVALFWLAHTSSKLPVTESEWIEDLIELVVRRDEIVEEIAAAPDELRGIIAEGAARFIADDAARWTLRRSLPDARQVPGIADAALDRFARIASHAVRSRVPRTPR
jgi:hypothetical protein